MAPLTCLLVPVQSRCHGRPSCGWSRTAGSVCRNRPHRRRSNSVHLPSGRSADRRAGQPLGIVDDLLQVELGLLRPARGLPPVRRTGYSPMGGELGAQVAQSWTGRRTFFSRNVMMVLNACRPRRASPARCAGPRHRSPVRSEAWSRRRPPTSMWWRDPTVQAKASLSPS